MRAVLETSFFYALSQDTSQPVATYWDYAETRTSNQLVTTAKSATACSTSKRICKAILASRMGYEGYYLIPKS